MNARKLVLEQHLVDGATPTSVVRHFLRAHGGVATRAASALGFAHEEAFWKTIARYGLTGLPAQVRDEIARERQW